MDEQFKRDTSLNIYQRINMIMNEVDYIQKSDKKVNNQYRFVSHDQVTAILHGPLTKWGIAVIPTTQELIQEGNRTTCKLEVKFVNVDKPEDIFSIIYYGYGIDAQDKGPGKAISYAFKYAMLKTFCLETGDDPDEDQSTNFDKNKVPGKPKEEPKIDDNPCIEEIELFTSQYPDLDENHIKDFFQKMKNHRKCSMAQILEEFRNHEHFQKIFAQYQKSLKKSN